MSKGYFCDINMLTYVSKAHRNLREVVSEVSAFLNTIPFFHFQVACLTHVAANYLNCKIEAKRWGTAHGSIVPYQVSRKH